MREDAQLPAVRRGGREQHPSTSSARAHPATDIAGRRPGPVMALLRTERRGSPTPAVSSVTCTSTWTSVAFGDVDEMHSLAWRPIERAVLESYQHALARRSIRKSVRICNARNRTDMTQRRSQVQLFPFGDVGEQRLVAGRWSGYRLCRNVMCTGSNEDERGQHINDSHGNAFAGILLGQRKIPLQARRNANSQRATRFASHWLRYAPLSPRRDRTAGCALLCFFPRRGSLPTEQ